MVARARGDAADARRAVALRRLALGPVRARCWRSSPGARRFAAFGAAIGAPAREVRASSLLAFMVSLPIAFLSLVPVGHRQPRPLRRDQGDPAPSSRSTPPSTRSRARSTRRAEPRRPAAPPRRSWSSPTAPWRGWRCAGSPERPSSPGRTPAGGARPGHALESAGRELPRHPHAQAAANARPARAGARDRSVAATPGAAAVRGRGRGACARRCLRCPASSASRSPSSSAEAAELQAVGIGAVILFGIPASKDEAGSGAYDAEGVVQMAVRALKEAHPELVVITDVCLCEYTSHGHCGVVRDGEVDNDITVELLAKTAISQADAGADVVAPSDMMDGRIGAIRSQLDEEGHSNVAIIAYSAKYASAFYGPFREAAESTPAVRRPPRLPDGRGERARGGARGGARPGRGRRRRDGEAGDALPRCDPPSQGRKPGAPVGAYQVSGEYSMLKAAAQNGWIDERAAVLESADRDPARRRRPGLHLLREGGRGLALSGAGRAAQAASAEGALAPRRRGDPARRRRQAAHEPAPVELPARARAVRGRRRAPRSWTVDEVLSRTQRLLDERIIREITPIFDTRALGYASMLVAAKVDDEHPQRAAQIINSHPGVSHNYLRTHEFNLWFTIATPPDSELGPRGHARGPPAADRRRVDPPAPDADPVQDQHEPGDGAGTPTRSRRRSRPRRRASSSASPTTTATSR